MNKTILSFMIFLFWSFELTSSRILTQSQPIDSNVPSYKVSNSESMLFENQLQADEILHNIKVSMDPSIDTQERTYAQSLEFSTSKEGNLKAPNDFSETNFKKFRPDEVVKVQSMGERPNEISMEKIKRPGTLIAQRSSSLNVKESSPYLPRTKDDRQKDKEKGKQFLDPRYKNSIVYGHKFHKNDIIYLLIYVFFFLFVIEISMLIVFFFKQNKSYIANHMTLNFFCMLGQTINNIVYYSKKSDFEIDEWSFWFEVFIFLLFVLQILLGNMLNKRLLNPKLVRKIFLLRLLHRVSAVIIYVGTKAHILYITYSMFYNEYKTVFYILSCMGVLFYLMLYLAFYFCLLDVRHYEFNGPFLVDTSKDGKVLKEMLINIESGQFEQPNLHQNFEMKLKDFEGTGKCPFSEVKVHENDRIFFGMKQTQNLQILPEEQGDEEAGRVQNKMSSINPIVPWFLLEDKVFDLRNLRHPKGLYILYGLAYQDITRELYGLKSMRFENKKEKFFRNLQHCHVNRTFHLIRKHCIGFIDTNKNLIIKNKDKQLLSRIKKDLVLHKTNIKANKKEIFEGGDNDSSRSRSSLTSGGSSSSMGFNTDLLHYVDRNSLRNKYSRNWEVHSSVNLNKKVSMYWIWVEDHKYLLNMKNYWVKNFGKYFFLKKGDLKQYYYVCMAAHPKYLARKYLAFGISPNSVVNLMYLKMPTFVQSLIKAYLGFNLMDMSTDYADTFLPPELFENTANPENSLSLLVSLLGSADKLGIQSPPLQEIVKHSFVKDKSIQFETPDEISSLDTPLSQFIPLIESPINSIGIKKNLLNMNSPFELKSGLGLGFNFGNFTNKKIVFLVKDFGIIPLMDFLEVLLQVRVLQLNNLILNNQNKKENSNVEFEEHQRIEERLKFVRSKVDEFKEKAGVPGDKSDFTYETIRPFEEEYLLTFSNRPEFRIYWELNLFTFENDKTIFEFLGLQILKEFEIIDKLVESMVKTETNADQIPIGIQALDEEEGEAKDASNVEFSNTEIEQKDSQMQLDSHMMNIEWDNDQFGSLEAPSLVKKVVINTTNKVVDEFCFDDGVVQVINKDTKRLKYILEELDASQVEKLILSGSDTFNARVLKDSPIPLQYVTIL